METAVNGSMNPAEQEFVPREDPHSGSFELTVLKDGESDRDQIFIRNTPIMGVDDPDDFGSMWSENRGRIRRKSEIPIAHRNTSQSEEAVKIFGFLALGLPRNDSQRFWSTTKKIVHLCNRRVNREHRSQGTGYRGDGRESFFKEFVRIMNANLPPAAM